MPSVDAGPFSILKKASRPPRMVSYGTLVHRYHLLRRWVHESVAWWLGRHSQLEMWTIDAGLCGGASNDKPLCAEGVPILWRAPAKTLPVGTLWPLCRERRLRVPLVIRLHRAVLRRCGLCNLNTASGVRARQLCPSTCGCDDPHAPLALSLPSGGCGEQCALRRLPRATGGILRHE